MMITRLANQLDSVCLFFSFKPNTPTTKKTHKKEDFLKMSDDSTPPSGWIPMRQPIDVNRLGTYLEGKVPGFVNRDIKIWQANNGMSNPTYMMWMDSNETTN